MLVPYSVIWVIRTAPPARRETLCGHLILASTCHVVLRYIHPFFFCIVNINIIFFLDIWHRSRWRAKRIGAWRIIKMGSQIDIKIPRRSGVGLHVFLARRYGVQRDYTQKQVIFITKKKKKSTLIIVKSTSNTHLYIFFLGRIWLIGGLLKPKMFVNDWSLHFTPQNESMESPGYWTPKVIITSFNRTT